MAEAVTETQAADTLTKGPAPFSLSAPESEDRPKPKSDNLVDISNFWGEGIQGVIADLEAKLAPSRAAIAKQEEKYGQTIEQVVKPALAEAKAQYQKPGPKLPEMLPTPPQPDISARPFNASHKDALGSVVQTLGLMAQMAMGSGKAPKAALGAFTGAMQGWAEGDSIRAERNWKEYLGQVDTIRQENRQALALWEEASKQHGQNQQAATAALSTALAAAGLEKDALNVAEKGFDRSLHDFGLQQQLINQSRRIALEMEQLRVRSLYEQRMDEWRKSQEEGARRRDEETARYHRAQEAKAEEARIDSRRRIELAEQAGARAGKLAEARLQVLQMPAQAVKLAQQDIGITQRLKQRERLQEAVEYLDKAGVIPKGATLADTLKAKATLQTKMGDEEINKHLQALDRWGTSLLVSSEVQTMGGSAVLRIAQIAKQEAGNVRSVPKAFWDDFLKDSGEGLKQQQKTVRSLLGAYKGAQGVISGAMSEAGMEHEVPEPPSGFKAVTE